MHVNPTTVALTFLLGILFVANRLGLRFSVYMSLLAALALNLFFLPPIGTLTIADSQNWIALLAFLTASVSASHLSNRVKQEARDANQRRREVERLYEFSQKLMTPDRPSDLLNKIPDYISSTFHNAAVAIYLLDRDEVYLSLPVNYRFTKEELHKVAICAETNCNSTEDACTAPLLLGVQSMGSIGITGNLPSRETIDALGGLVAIAVERSLTAERLARTEATQENERLRTALLDSLTHELRTPLTAIKASVTSLRSGMIQDLEMQAEMLTVIDEESDRLNRLIGQAVEMAQLDAQHVQLQLEPQQIRQLVEDAVLECEPLLEKHPVEIRIPPGLPSVRMDANWIRKVLHHLLENAAKYSAQSKPIVISAEVRNSSLITSVADQGAGIEDFDKALIFDKFYRGQSQRYRVQGTGMGLAIVKAIMEAHGGTVDVASQKGTGSVFFFTLPLQ
jgi:two-component system sensor histidine kinase KdpD